MAVDWTAVKTALRAWFIAATALPDARVVWANQAAPRPVPPFAELNPHLAMTPLGAYDEERTDPTTPGRIDRVGQRRMTVSCHTFGPNAIALMELAQEALDTYAVRTILDVAGLSVLQRGEVRDMTKALETQYEERAQLDVIFGLAAASSEDVGYIHTFGLDATFKNPDGTTGGGFSQTNTLP